MPAEIIDSTAVALLIELEAEGFTLRLTDRETLRVEPGSRLTREQRQQLRDFKAPIIEILRGRDQGVMERRQVFQQQLDGVEPPRVPPLLFKPHVPYTIAVCFSCAESNGRQTFGRCWRCSLAMRLVLRLPTTSTLAGALDEARIA